MKLITKLFEFNNCEVSRIVMYIKNVELTYYVDYYTIEYGIETLQYQTKHKTFKSALKDFKETININI